MIDFSVISTENFKAVFEMFGPARLFGVWSFKAAPWLPTAKVLRISEEPWTDESSFTFHL